MKRSYGRDEARSIAESLEIDFAKSQFDLEQFRAGLDVEAEHGQIDPETNVTNDDPLTTGKIALAHLNEIPDYYTRLRKMETDPESPKTPELKGAEASGNRGIVKKLLVGLVLAFLVAVYSRVFRKGRR